MKRITSSTLLILLFFFYTGWLKEIIYIVKISCTNFRVTAMVMFSFRREFTSRAFKGFSQKVIYDLRSKNFHPKTKSLLVTSRSLRFHWPRSKIASRVLTKISTFCFRYNLCTCLLMFLGSYIFWYIIHRVPKFVA